jgi:AraC-like DNA-binding protein
MLPQTHHISILSAHIRDFRGRIAYNSYVNPFREIVEPPPSRSFRLLSWERSLADIELCVGPGRMQPITGAGERWHAHAAVEITYIDSGYGSRFVGDHMASIDPPELVVLGPHLPHHWSGLAASRGVAVQFDRGAHSALAAVCELGQLEPVWHAAERGLLFSGTLARELGQTMLAMLHDGPLRQLARLLELLDSIAHQLAAAQPLSSKAFSLSSGALHADAVARAIELLLGHFSEDLTVDDLATAVDLPRATLCRYFRRYTGRSIVAFLNGIRIDQAKRLLADSQLQIGQIALQAGFNNLSNFNRQFRKVVGVAPRDFRSQQHTWPGVS